MVLTGNFGIFSLITFLVILTLWCSFLAHVNALWSSLVCLFFSFQPVLHDWCDKDRGMYYPVCGMFMYVCVCIYVCMYVYMYVCMYVCIYIRTYVGMYVCMYYNAFEYFYFSIKNKYKLRTYCWRSISV